MFSITSQPGWICDKNCVCFKSVISFDSSFCNFI